MTEMEARRVVENRGMRLFGLPAGGDRTHRIAMARVDKDGKQWSYFVDVILADLGEAELAGHMDGLEEWMRSQGFQSREHAGEGCIG